VGRRYIEEFASHVTLIDTNNTLGNGTKTARNTRVTYSRLTIRYFRLIDNIRARFRFDEIGMSGRKTPRGGR